MRVARAETAQNHATFVGSAVPIEVPRLDKFGGGRHPDPAIADFHAERQLEAVDEDRGSIGAAVVRVLKQGDFVVRDFSGLIWG